MNKQPEESVEHNKYLEFTQTAEYKRMTEGENAVFPNFNCNSAEDLHKMRDYIYRQIPEIQRKNSFKDYDSPRLSQMQIGQALIAREAYRKYERENPVHIGSRNTTFYTNSYKPLGRVPGLSSSIRC